jgi:hypothetical protein
VFDGEIQKLLRLMGEMREISNQLIDKDIFRNRAPNVRPGRISPRTAATAPESSHPKRFGAPNPQLPGKFVQTSKSSTGHKKAICEQAVASLCEEST